MPSRHLRFPGSTGAELAARLDLPEGAPRAYALFAHCFTCSKDLKAAGHITRTLAQRGIATLRFDFTGIGQSGGDFADTDFQSNLDDLVAAADFMRRELAGPRLLVGHSLGGAAVLAAAHRVEEAVAVATLGAPSDTEHLRGLLLEEAPQLAEQESAKVHLAGRTFTVHRKLLDDLAEANVRAALSRLGRALLLLHSPADEIVDIDHATRLYKAARHPKSFVSLDDADHLLSREADARYAGEVLAAWASRYVDEGMPAQLAAADRDASADTRHGWLTVSGGAEGYRQTVAARRHRLAADEPVEVGGTDRGPTPYELLLAGLGACTNMTLRMYVERKGWPLTGVRSRLHHSRIHAEDCADCVTEKGRVDRIEREIELQGPLDDEQRQRLLEIADRCPVHRTLSGEINIQSRLVDDASAGEEPD